MAVIMCHSLTPGPESKYLAYTAGFTSIIRNAVENYTNGSASGEKKRGTGGEISDRFVDVRWAPPLYYAALKCRVRRVRWHAVALLGRLECSEGVWDARLVAAIARRVGEMEERGVLGGARGKMGFAVEEVPSGDEGEGEVLPEWDLFFDVEVDVPDGFDNGALLVCRRRRVAEVDVVKCYYDGQEWHDGGGMRP